MSTFNPLIPTGSVKLSFDYRNLQNNMQQLDTSMAINHFAFSDATANNGKHKFVEMVNNGAIPATAAGEATMYSITNTGVTDLYMTPDNSGNQYRLTNVNAAKIADFGKSKIGWTFLPGGMILNYGFISTPSSSPNSGTITFKRPYTDVTSIIVFGQLNYSGSSPSGVNQWYYSISTLGLTTFDWVNSGNSNHVDGFSWWALGL
jgi:hypothetical protein